MPRPFVSKKIRTKHSLLQWFSVYPQNWQHVDVVRKRQRKWQHGAQKKQGDQNQLTCPSVHIFQQRQDNLPCYIPVLNPFILIF
jgi:hypothetical protein